MATIVRPRVSDRTGQTAWWTAGLALVIGANAIVASPVLADAWDICSGSHGPEVIITCSNVIEYTKNPANREDAYVNRGIQYFSMGNTDLAIADYTSAIKLDPTDAIAFNNRGNALADKGEFKRAIADYSEAIRLKPQYEHAFLNRGITYLGLKDYDRAITDFDQAIRLNPNDASAFNNRGLAKLKKGDMASGNEDVTWARHLQPGIGESH